MIAGVLFRLALCALFFAVARYALETNNLSSILRDASRQFKGTDDGYDGLMAYQAPLSKVFYGFSALFFLFAGLFLYHHMRALRVHEDPASQARPYGGMQPGGQPAPEGRPSQTGQPPAQPYGGQPAAATTQPSGGATPYGGSGQPSSTVQPSGGATPYGSGPQPYGRR